LRRLVSANKVGQYLAQCGVVEVLLVEEGHRAGIEARTVELAVRLSAHEHNSS
jgi:hypothetical protein